MNAVAAIIGYAFMAVTAITALLWAWEVTMRKIWRRAMDSRDFYKVAVRYAKETRGPKDKLMGYEE
jgi:hypothetical protein